MREDMMEYTNFIDVPYWLSFYTRYYNKKVENRNGIFYCVVFVEQASREQTSFQSAGIYVNNDFFEDKYPK